VHHHFPHQEYQEEVVYVDVDHLDDDQVCHDGVDVVYDDYDDHVDYYLDYEVLDQVDLD